jgi:hypothetical protein
LIAAIQVGLRFPIVSVLLVIPPENRCSDAILQKTDSAADLEVHGRTDSDIHELQYTGSIITDGFWFISPVVTAVGIPPDAIELLIVVDAIPDIFGTTLNVTRDLVSACIVSRNHPPEVNVDWTFARDMSATS